MNYAWFTYKISTSLFSSYTLYLCPSLKIFPLVFSFDEQQPRRRRRPLPERSKILLLPIHRTPFPSTGGRTKMFTERECLPTMAGRWNCTVPEARCRNRLPLGQVLTITGGPSVVVVVLLPLRRRRARLLKRCRRWTPRETRRAECRSFGWSYWQKVVVRSLLMFSDRYVWIMNIVINSIYTL